MGSLYGNSDLIHPRSIVYRLLTETLFMEGVLWIAGVRLTTES